MEQCYVPSVETGQVDDDDQVFKIVTAEWYNRIVYIQC